LRPALFWKDDRFTEDIPISAKFVPDDDRWKRGWFGRGGASEAREPETERACPTVNGAFWLPDSEFERFMADAGWGMLEL
jgi:hypothetical protein